MFLVGGDYVCVVFLKLHFERAKVKYVLVDHSKLGRFSGFAEVSENYGKCLAEMDIPDIHFVYMVPRRFIGHFGDKVSYISLENPIADLKRLGIRIDLWHATDQLFKFRLRTKGMRQLLTVHDLITIHNKKGIHKLKHGLRLRWRVFSSDYISVISNYVGEDLRDCCLLGDRPVTVIPDGVRELEKDPRTKPSFAGENEKFFLAVGQVCPRKNYEAIIKMMRYFPEHKLYICGICDSGYSRKLKARLESSVEKDRIVLTGGLNNWEKNWLYANCEALLMPSLMEGFGLPVVEAMRFCKPVFCAATTSLPQIGDKYAFYWDNLSPEAMADVVRGGLAKFSPEVDGIAEHDYSNKYTYREFTQRYLELYRKILYDSEEYPVRRKQNLFAFLSSCYD